MATSNFPSSLDTTSALPASISDTASLNSPNHADMHEVTNDAIIEIEEKVGTGDTTASTGAVLIGTGSGASAWDTTPTFLGDVTVGVDGTGHDVKFYGDSASHYMLWDQSADSLVLTLDSGIYFYDVGGEVIQAAGDGHLNIDAGTTLDLTAPTIDLNASTKVNIDGVVDITDTTDSSDATGDTGALRCEGGASIAKKLYVGTDLDVDGTTNLDAVDIDGNVQLDGTFTIGANDTGYDFKLHGATVDKFLLWDESDNMLEITGVNGTNALAIHDGNLYVEDSVDIEGNIDVNGTANLDGVDIDGAVDMASTLTLAGNADFNGDLDVQGTTNLDGVDIDGQLTLANGSAGAPAIAFGSDTDLGFYRGAADHMALAATLPVVTSFTTLRRGTNSTNVNILGADSSSRRYKENIADFTKSDWENVYNLQAVNFNWKEEVDAQRTRSFGLIAEDVAEQIPELGVYRVVDSEGDTPVVDSVNYEQLCVYLLEVVKDLNNRLETLEG